MEKENITEKEKEIYDKKDIWRCLLEAVTLKRKN